MGVAGLWDILKPTAKNRSLTDLAIKEGFEANPDGKREYGREGENPVLRTLFFRCATLMHTTFLPIFVFDGPKRPDVKRGKKINRTSHKLIPGMKQIVEAFGFEWRMAPGEAEAELAYLNRIGVIDGVLSDDVDNFLSVPQRSSSTLSGNRANPVLNSAGKDDKNHTRVFRLQDITEHPDVRLTRGGMILIGLMSGGDYQQGGLMRCGTTTAHALAKCGFGDSLYEAANNLDRHQLAEFLVAWRNELRQELRTNSRGHIGRKQVALAKSIPEEFPDVDILLSYVRPITSESMGRESNNIQLTWSKEPNLAKLAETCEFYFEWGYREAIIKRFRTVMWHSIVLRILRRAALDLDARTTSATGMPATPRKKKDKETEACGTPSKMITQHFSSLGLTSPTKVYISGSESEGDDDEERLLIKVHSTRTHTSTDGLPEYRLEVAPKQLVRLTESGIKGIRVPEGPDEWASENEEDEDGATKKRGNGQPIDPETHLRVWMPACMVKLVEPRLVQEFEDIQEQKRLKKAKKGSRGTSAVEKPPRKAKKPAAKLTDDLSDKMKAVQPETAVSVQSSSEEGESSDPDIPSHENSTSHIKDLEAVGKPNEFLPSPVSSRTGIKDLTKKKKPSTIAGAHPNDLKSFFSVTQSLTTTALKKHPGSSNQTASHIHPATQTSANISGSSRTKALAELRNNTGTTSNRMAGPSTSSGLPKKGKAPTTSKLAPSQYSKALCHSDDSSFEEYNIALWNKGSTTADPAQSSPSKRKIQYRTTSSPSESEPSERVKKSPRKNTFPQSTRRPISPSPASSRLPVKKAVSEVIEISDSDSDAAVSSKPVRRKVPPIVASEDIIDLT
ncbi:hypothetical protein BDZ97DRAFT_1806082 [Flammula alnicola]|nr:hypothetical protein BDZ97DRAFT_1806082 [Flammula alnicola]